MKKLLLLFTISSLSLQAQDVVTTNWFFGDVSIVQSSRIDRANALDSYSYTEEEKKNILEKQYLFDNYNDSRVDNYTTAAYLKYNLFNNEMEFTKDGLIYYLKKEKGRTVRFTDSNSLYRVYEVDGNLQFLMVEMESKNSLLVKQSSEFILPKKTRSTYGHHKKADFKRKKDEYFISLENGQTVKVPYKKKEFFKIFGANAGKIKNYISSEKLNHRNIKDLKKVITFLDDLEVNQ